MLPRTGGPLSLRRTGQACLTLQCSGSALSPHLQPLPARESSVLSYIYWFSPSLVSSGHYLFWYTYSTSPIHYNLALEPRVLKPPPHRCLVTRMILSWVRTMSSVKTATKKSPPSRPGRFRSKLEMAWLGQNNKCLHCTEAGHKSSDWPRKAASKPASAMPAAYKAAKE